MFLARTDEQKRFKLGIEELLAGSIVNEQSPVILVHGTGGMGKSELCNRFVEIGRGEVSGTEGNGERFVVIKVDWQEERDNHSSDYPVLTGPRLPVILSALHDRVASSREFEDKQGGKRLDRAFAPYLRVVTRLTGAEEGDEPGAGAGVLDSALAAGAQVAGAALGMPLPGEALGGVRDGVRVMRRTKGDDAEKVALAQRPYELLMREFARGLRELSEVKPIILVLDTYELITSCGGWIRQVMGQTGGRVLWVLAGRLENEEDAGRWGEIASFRRELPERDLAVMRVSPFDRSTVSELLDARGFPSLDEQAVDAIAVLTHGVPLAVSIVSSLLGNETLEEISRAVTKEGDASKVVRELTERYLRHAENDPDLKPDIPLLFGLSLLYADRTDLDLIGALWGEETEVGALLTGLAARHDFVLTGRRRLHQEVRETFQKYILNQVERTEYAPNNRRAADLAQTRVDAAAGRSARESLDSKEWRDAQATVIWHRFWVDNADGLTHLCEVFPEAVLFERSFAHELVGLASFFSETFSEQQASLLRGLASLLSFGSFMDGWFARRRAAFQRDRTPVRGAESTDGDRENAFEVLRRRVGSDSSTPRRASQVAAVELVIAKASLRSDPSAALTALERAVDLISDKDTDLHQEVSELAGSLVERLARPPAGEEPSVAAIRVAELTMRYKQKSPADFLFLAEVHDWVGKREEAVERFAEIVSRFGGDDDAETRRIVSQAMLERGVALGELGRVKDAVRAFDELSERDAESEDLDLRQRVATASLNKADLLQGSGDVEAAIETFQDIAARYGGAASPGLRRTAVRAVSGLAIALAKTDKLGEAVTALDDLIERFDDDGEMKVAVVELLGNKGSLLNAEGKAEAALDAFERLLVKATGEADEAIQHHVLTALLDKAGVLTALDRAEEALSVFEEAEKQAEKLAGPEVDVQIAEGLIEKGQALARLARYDDELATYDDVVKRFEPAVNVTERRVVVRALAVKAAALSERKMTRESLRVYRQLEKEFGGDRDPDVQVGVAVATLNHAMALDVLGYHEEELACYERVLELSRGVARLGPVYASALRSKVITLEELDRDEDALAVSEELLRHLEGPDASEGLLDADLVVSTARALLARAKLLDATGHHEEALEEFDALVRQYAGLPNENLGNYVGEARFQLALERGANGEFAEAVALYDAILGWERGELDTELVASSLANKAGSIGSMGRRDEAIELLEEVFDRYGSSPSANLRRLACVALVNRAVLLKDLGKSAEAIWAYREVEEKFRDDNDEVIRAHSCRSLIKAAELLASSEGPGEAADAYLEVVNRYADDPQLFPYVAQAMGLRGRALTDLGEPLKALGVFEDLTSRFADSTDRTVRHHMATAFADRARLLLDAECAEEALAVYAETARRFDGDSDPRLREAVAEALFARASILSSLGRHDEELAVNRELMDAFSSAPEERARWRAALASFNVAMLLRGRESDEAALIAAGEVIARFRDDEKEEIQAVVTNALLLRGSLLGPAEGIGLLDEVCGRCEGREDPAHRQMLLSAYYNKGRLLQRDDDRDDAITAFDRLIGAVNGSGLENRLLAEGLLAKAEVLTELEDLDGGMAICRELIVRLGREEGDEEIRVRCAHGLAYLATIQGKLDLFHEQLVTYREITDRYGEDDAPRLRRVVANALIGEAYLLVRDEDTGAALSVYQSLVDRYAGDEDTEMRRFVIKAFWGQIFLLKGVDRVEERIALYADFLKRFDDGGALDDQTRDAIVSAMINKAVLEAKGGDAATLGRAEAALKRAIDLSDGAPALGAYALFLQDERNDRDGARHYFERAFAADPEDAGSVGNFARMLFEDGELDRAMEMTEQALAHLTEAEGSLRLELNFYLAALGPPERRAEAFAAARGLLDDGIRSADWNLDGILARAAAKDAPDTANAPRMSDLEKMAQEISGT